MLRHAAIIHLGCPKNLVDSETMAAQLEEIGFTLSADPACADLILVNTCGFLQSAVEEAIDTILEVARHKEVGRCQWLVVAGCMVQRYGKKLLALLPEVDLFLGTSHPHLLAEVWQLHRSGSVDRLWMAAPHHLVSSATRRLRSTPTHSAYLKIAEGCSNHCSYCIIPRLRGPMRSRSVADVLAEAEHMVREGVREINLIAQDITAYGLDRGDRHGLVRLLEALEDLAGLTWVRLLYAYPGRIDDALLTTMAQSAKTVPYLDFPIQHCVPRILERMHRGLEWPHIEDLVAKIRRAIPQVALRTTVMVGFPGESAEEFHELVQLVERVQFDHLGVFAFSSEPGSRAAKMPDQVSRATKAKRQRELLARQREISARRLTRLVGRTLTVLVEGVHPESDLLLAGRLAIQAPEVDGIAIITRGDARVGEFRSMRVSAVHDYDVVGELADAPPAAAG